MLTPVYLQCRECANRFRIERIGQQTYIGYPRICPGCGSNSTESSIDSDTDYWYSLAQAFGYPPTDESAKLIRGLFNLWDGQQHKSFREFMESIQDED